MQPSATVLLLHQQRADTHLDWMIDLPERPGGLATFRCDAAWPDWSHLGRVGLTELPPHRRAWLERQGPASGDRGRARRLGRGVAEVTGLHPHGWNLQLSWPDGPGIAAGRAEGRVVRLHRDRWEFLAATPAGRAGPGSILRPRVGAAR